MTTFNEQFNIYPETKTWDDLKCDKKQKNIYKTNANFMATNQEKFNFCLIIAILSAGFGIGLLLGLLL